MSSRDTIQIGNTYHDTRYILHEEVLRTEGATADRWGANRGGPGQSTACCESDGRAVGGESKRLAERDPEARQTGT